MTLPKSLITITPLSKILAAVLFVLLPFLGFYLGREYQKAITPVPTASKTTDVIATQKPAIDSTANWKTYTNREYGFEFKYPNIWSSTSAGPNEAMKQALNGKEISGTVQPSFDTIIFSDEKGKNFDIGIFEYKKELSPKEYEKGYLYTLGPCDLRFGFTADKVEMTNKFSVQFLKVDGKLTSDKSPTSYLTCYYTKNEKGKAFVFSINLRSSGTDSTIINQILSTFKFLDN